MLTLLIPVSDQESAVHFYRDIMGFPEEDGEILITEEGCRTCMNFIDIEKETEVKYNLRKGVLRFPTFRYSVEGNFLSYCKRLVDQGVKFDLVAQHPGGYFARIIDPFGNSFEVECASFDQDDNSINPLEWDFYKRY